MEELASLIHQMTKRLRSRDITQPEEVAKELLRIHLAHEAYEEKSNKTEAVSPQLLYERMKTRTEKALGPFKGDQELFWDWYQSFHQIDLLAGIELLLQDQRVGYGFCPAPLLNNISSNMMENHQARQVLIPEACKYPLRLLHQWLGYAQDKEFTLTAVLRWQVELLRYLFRHDPHVQVKQIALESYFEWEQEFDLIWTIPTFSNRIDPEESEPFITSDSEGISLENSLRWLSPKGELQILISPRFTFIGGSFLQLRKEVTKHYRIRSIYSLPEGFFRPVMGVRTFWYTISRYGAEEVELGEFQLDGPKDLIATKLKTFPHAELHTRTDWRWELLIEDKSEYLQSLLQKKIPIYKLSEVGDLFRGKSILKNHLHKGGSISVVNISNLQDGQVVWEGLDQIQEDYRKVKRYEIEEGDLLLTCRGTVRKIAVAKGVPERTILSANLISIRFDQRVLSDYVRVFLESPTGMQLVDSLQMGTTVMNLSPKDLGELEIPVPPLATQQKIAEEYQREHQHYLTTMAEANRRWETKRHQIYQQLFE